MNDADTNRLKFLRALDSSEVNATEWEAEFIESQLSKDYIVAFSDKQREVIDKMMTRYAERIGW